MWSAVGSVVTIFSPRMPMSTPVIFAVGDYLENAVAFKHLTFALTVFGCLSLSNQARKSDT